MRGKGRNGNREGFFLSSGHFKSSVKKIMHSVPVEQYPPEHAHMPNVVAATDPIKTSWVKPLGYLHGIYNSTCDVDGNLYHD